MKIWQKKSIDKEQILPTCVTKYGLLVLNYKQIEFKTST